MKTRKDNQQQYDRTARWLVERSKEALLSTFFNIEADSIEFIRQEPQQVVHIGSSDFPLRIRQNGREAIFLLELQTHWNWQKAQKMLYYYVIFQEKYQVPVIPCMLLFLKNSKATDLYEDERVKFQFDLTRLWELPAEKYIDTTLELLPFVPLMDGGLKCVDDIEHRIYNASRTNMEKSQLLVTLTILTGLLDKGLAADLVGRRRELMIESPAYDIMREDLKPFLREELREEFRPIFREELRPQLTEELKPQLTEELKPQLTEELRPQLTEELRPQLTEELRPQLRKENMQEVARRLLSMGHSVAVVRQATDLSVEEILCLSD